MTLDVFEPVAERLRQAAHTLRRTPTPLSHMIPLMQEAADRIDQLARERATLLGAREHPGFADTLPGEYRE